MAAERVNIVFGAASPILQAISASLFFSDSKEFVDMPLKRDPEEVLSQFETLKNNSGGNMDKDMLAIFVRENFDPAGSDVAAWIPPDLPPEPPFLTDLRTARSISIDPKLADWIHHLHNLWGVLGRKTSDSVSFNPQKHTALSRRNPLVVPGGRFREGYYWDSLWIVRGLLVSGAVETAAGMVANMLVDVQEVGFVPNGARAYYLNRSQPPLLSEMVAALLKMSDHGACNASATVGEVLRGATQLLQSEHAWWMSAAGGKRVVLERGGRRATLNRYWANTERARPESFREDEAAVSGLPAARRPQVLREISTAAESGWDFSERWFVEAEGRGASGEEGGGAGAGGGAEAREEKLQGLRVTRTVPVDLNVYLLRMERTLSELLRREGNAAEAARFSGMAATRGEAMNAWMWSPAEQRWLDLVLPVGPDSDAGPEQLETGEEGQRAARRGRADGSEGCGGWESGAARVVTEFRQRGGAWAAASDYFPLWGGLTEGWSEGQVGAVVGSLARSGLVQDGGVQTTTCEGSQEQWDGPNAWPPVQSIIVDGLYATGNAAAKQLAGAIVQRWLGSNFAGWEKTGFMFEKYNAREPGKGGQGGEYTPQVGFGWTNGVALEMLRDHLDLLADRSPLLQPPPRAAAIASE